MKIKIISIGNNPPKWVWSLSDFTLPHSLVKVIRMEQLYRASSILNNYPYHRE